MQKYRSLLHPGWCILFLTQAALGQTAGKTNGLLPISSTPPTESVISFPKLGKITPRNAKEIDDSTWSIGCETLDRVWRTIPGVGASTGGALATYLTGRVVDFAGYQPVFLAAGLAAFVACLALFFWIGKISPQPQPVC